MLDSAPLYDAVATQDTVTMLRAGVRGVLRVVDPELEQELRAVLVRDDDYASAGKPPCDWDDPEAREQVVDALVKDANACLGHRPVLRDPAGPDPRASSRLVFGEDALNQRRAGRGCAANTAARRVRAVRSRALSRAS